MTHFTLRYAEIGRHVSAHLFSGPNETETHAKNGDLVFTLEEWQSFLRCFQDRGQDRILVIPEK